MALSRTNVHSQASAEPHGTGDFTTSSFTPPDNCLLVVAVATMRVTTATDLTSSITCAGGGWTYTPRAGLGSNTDVFSVSTRIFTAPVTTGASMTLTIGTGGINMQFYAVSVVAYTGYDTGTPTGATGSLLVESAGTPDGAQSFTLSGAPATDSEVFAAITLDKDAAGTTPGAGWTEIHDVQAGGAGGVQSQIRTGSTSTTVAWVDTNTGGNIFKFVASAVEIKAAAGAGGPVLMPRAVHVAG
ncbi:MAG: hypothetical protein ACRD0W_06540 [Acidimicrobiales bacterium]